MKKNVGGIGVQH